MKTAYQDEDMAALKRDAIMGQQLASIVMASSWSAAERLTAAVLVVNAHTRPEFGYRVVEDCSADKVAKWLGMSSKTAGEAMRALQDGGVIQREINKMPVNRYGTEIPRSKMDLSRGDRWQAQTTIALPLELTLPETLVESKNIKRTRVVNAKRMAELRDLKEQVQKLLDHAPCPHCGEVGHLHATIGATCTSCGTVLSESEVEAIAGTEIISEPDGPPNFAPEPPAPDTRRALADLKGRASIPTPTIDYRDLDEGTLDIKLPNTEREMISLSVMTQTEGPEVAKTEKTSAPSLEKEIISTPEEAQTGGLGVAEPQEVLSGVATLEFLANLDVAFCLVGGKGGKKPCDEFGAPLTGNYLDLPQALPVATAELKRGGTVGMLPEHSASLTLMDIDAGLDSFFAMCPPLANAPRVIRANAPDRAKLLIAITDPGPKLQRQDAKQPTRKAELLGRGHGNVAGVHPSGVPYELLTGELMVFSRAQIEAMLAQWIPNAYTEESTSSTLQTPPVCASQANARYSETLVEAAIAVWNKTHKTEVEQAVAKCTRSGRHYSTRVNDKTPSTAKVSADAWRDFGQQPGGPDGKPLPVMDPLEMHLRLNPHLNKRDFIWGVVVPEYRAQKSVDAGR